MLRMSRFDSSIAEPVYWVHGSPTIHKCVGDIRQQLAALSFFNL